MRPQCGPGLALDKSTMPPEARRQFGLAGAVDVALRLPARDAAGWIAAVIARTGNACIAMQPMSTAAAPGTARIDADEALHEEVAGDGVWSARMSSFVCSCQMETPRAARKLMGLAGDPLTYVSKCRLQPNAVPVLPSLPIRSPALTRWPYPT